MAHRKIMLVFVHGWSVTHTDTYGGLPRRLSADAGAAGLDVQVEEIHLGKYISFHDEVRLDDIARAFNAAVKKQLAPLLKNNRRFVCITHSTGGPVIREWWHRFYFNQQAAGDCPMSHLIMLAPANFGSALAQLGKCRVSRMKFWFGGVEPGQGVLDWLELGSHRSWLLNLDWIHRDDEDLARNQVYPFVLTGQTIDRAFYDSLNSYTGELGSDGVVRAAAANLNSRYIKLVQQEPVPEGSGSSNFQAPDLKIDAYKLSPRCAFRIQAGKSHSGGDMGIMRSVHRGGNDPKSEATVKAILDAINVKNHNQYLALSARWDDESRDVQLKERLEKEDKIFNDRYFIHDRFSMVIFRVSDERGFAIRDYDLILTVGKESNPNGLPEGFLKDRQCNRLNPETISYYFNYDVMKGCSAVVDETGKKPRVVRESLPGIASLGLRIVPRPQTGFVHYLPCEISANAELLEQVLVPNGTTLIDICLHRVVHANVFDIEPLESAEDTSFEKTQPGTELVP